MSEVLDQETKTLATQIDELLSVVINAAEALRTQILAKKIDPRSVMRGEIPASLIFDIYALKANRYLACCYNLDLLFPPIFSNSRVLSCVDAWLLKYDSHYTKWTVEAFSLADGAKKFTHTLQPFRPDWLNGCPLITPVMTLTRAHTA
ncbi:unnamed protein product [marine sediment metagenome]|uniref:Uncharacterized protein n=1 Tax=marine sediment metagenome TaxID=412755 RepID=X1PWY3_9ZZZZ